MSLLRRLNRTFTVISFGIVFAALPLLSAHAVENGGIGGKPARPRADNPRTESIFVHEIKPGESVNDTLQVINNTDTEKTLLIYGADSQVSSGGSFACAQKADEPVNVGTWIKLSKNSVTLAPNSTEDVDFTIKVPESASAGEQNGCIVIQDAREQSETNGNGVVLSFRSAIRVAVTVPGDISKDLIFTNIVAKKIDGGIIRLSTGLKNNGNVSLDSDIKVAIKNTFGQDTRSAGGDFPVLANSEASFNFEVKKPFWGGWYNVQATATYNDDTSQSLGEEGSKKTIYSRTVKIFVAPEPRALLIEIVGLVVVGGGLAYLIWRQKHINKLKASSEEYTVKSKDTLQTIAKKHDVSWKNIARINHLKAPYHIEAGDKLKIPTKPNKEA